VTLKKTNKFNPSIYFWELWGLTVVGIVLIQLLTVSTSPIVLQEETHIIEWGRLFLEPTSDSSASWNFSKTRPSTRLNYVGALMQEVAFRASNFSFVAPRLLCLLGAIVAMYLMLIWIRLLGVSRDVAALISLCFFLDPIFVASYKVRVDSWAISACLMSVIFLKIIQKQEKNPFRSKLLAVMAGSSMVLSWFIWLSVPILFPLILSELYITFKNKELRTQFLHWKIVRAFFFGAGLSTLLLMLPMKREFALASIDSFSTIREGMGRPISENFRDLYVAFVTGGKSVVSLLVSIFVIFEVVRRKKFRCCLVGGLILVATGISTMRLAYFLPYIYTFLGLWCVEFGQSYSECFNLKSKQNKTIFVMLVYSIGISLILRTVVGLQYKNGRDYQWVVANATALLGDGEHKILIDHAHEYYPVGRKLGWKLYSSVTSGAVYTEQTFKNLINTVDYILTSPGNNLKLEEMIKKSSRFKLIRVMDSVPQGYRQENRRQWYKQVLPLMSYSPIALYRKTEQ